MKLKVVILAFASLVASVAYAQHTSPNLLPMYCDIPTGSFQVSGNNIPVQKIESTSTKVNGHIYSGISVWFTVDANGNYYARISDGPEHTVAVWDCRE
jgi:hypothetical protein